MPRAARIVVPGIPYHITQRGNRREDVFFCDGDRNVCLKLLLEYARKHGLAVKGYCLMTNHVHVVAVPERESTLGDVFKPVHLRYAQHVNWSQGITGRLWQGRFWETRDCPAPSLRGVGTVPAVSPGQPTTPGPAPRPTAAFVTMCGPATSPSWPNRWVPGGTILRTRDCPTRQNSCASTPAPAAPWAAPCSSISSKPCSTAQSAPARPVAPEKKGFRNEK